MLRAIPLSVSGKLENRYHSSFLHIGRRVPKITLR